jgi:hypothetical protein
VNISILVRLFLENLFTTKFGQGLNVTHHLDHMRTNQATLC